MAKNEPETAPASDPWPRPGDVGYYVGEWEAADEVPPRADELRRELVVFFIEDEKDGTLFYAHPTDNLAPGTAVARAATVWAYRAENGAVRRTLAESLRETARKDRDYGEKCLALADTLERLAAVAEKGDAGA